MVYFGEMASVTPANAALLARAEQLTPELHRDLVRYAEFLLRSEGSDQDDEGRDDPGAQPSQQGLKSP